MSQSGLSLTETHWYADNPAFPDIREVDVFIVMGGPMGVYDEAIFPWLIQEKKLIREAISLHKKVLGICLGAQLLAKALGANVYANHHKEIGWFPIHACDAYKEFASYFPKNQTVFHWHGDTFDLPDGAIRMASNEACLNQAFVWGNSVLGLQYHLEVAATDEESMVKHGKHDLVTTAFVQTTGQI